MTTLAPSYQKFPKIKITCSYSNGGGGGGDLFSLEEYPLT